MTALKLVSKETLFHLEENHLSRNLNSSERQEGIYIIRNGRKLISFCCNDYFGLSQNDQLINESIKATTKYGAGAGASRFITGNHPLYSILEKNICRLKNTEAACAFGSGYMANIGTIPALVAKGDLIIADKLSHSSILDGIKLSGAKLVRFKHNDINHLEKILRLHRNSYQNCLIITETVFSMDGDLAPINKIVKMAKEYDCWTMTDDAHGLGMYQSNDKVDVQMGTLSKAAGSYGGYVAGGTDIINLIRNKAKSLIYSTGLPPGVIAASNAGIEILLKTPKKNVRPLELAKIFCNTLKLNEPKSPIVPIITGDAKKTLEASKRLEEKGFIISAIRPPTVPQGTARLRFTFCSLHKEEHIYNLATAIEELSIIK